MGHFDCMTSSRFVNKCKMKISVVDVMRAWEGSKQKISTGAWSGCNVVYCTVVLESGQAVM